MVLLGPTATGKSAVGLAAARLHEGTEIISADAMCVYREMDVATAKPTAAERAEVAHHLVDVADPAEEYTVSRYQHDAGVALADIARRGGRPLLVGGTGLYVRSLVDGLAIPGRWPEVRRDLEAALAGPAGPAGLHARLAQLDPVAASRVHVHNHRRLVRALEVTIGSGQPFSSFGPGLQVYPPTPWVLLGLPFDAPTVDQRIADRLTGWLAHGLVDEVRRLSVRPGGLSRTARQALGYRELLAHVEHGVPLAQCAAEALRRTRRFARRQWSWFRRDPRVRWIGPGTDPVEVLRRALDARWETGPRDGV